ncbi:hypothetical protein ACFQ1S_14455 [Kibdelosporangium lantanae]|uniref:Uncharacterized protein n=1 Tax=Kibdelosporangium lantanae TaxID=1497396 RepID=A0ABW3M7L5_9PSEU
MADKRSHPWLPLSLGGAAFFYVVGIAAVTAVTVSALNQSITWQDTSRALLLTAIALLHAEAARNVERIRAKLQVGNKAELTRAALDRLGRDA